MKFIQKTKVRAIELRITQIKEEVESMQKRSDLCEDLGKAAERLSTAFGAGTIINLIGVSGATLQNVVGVIGTFASLTLHLKLNREAVRLNRQIVKKTDEIKSLEVEKTKCLEQNEQIGRGENHG